MDGCKEAIHVQWCHWPVTSVAFIMKVAVGPTAYLSKWRWVSTVHRLLVTLQRKYKMNMLKLSFPFLLRFIMMVWGKYLEYA